MLYNPLATTDKPRFGSLLDQHDDKEKFSAEYQIGSDILCALVKGTSTRRPLPRQLVLSNILPYYTYTKFRLYPKIDLGRQRPTWKVTDEGDLIAINESGEWRKLDIKTGRCLSTNTSTKSVVNHCLRMLRIASIPTMRIIISNSGESIIVCDSEKRHYIIALNKNGEYLGQRNFEDGFTYYNQIKFLPHEEAVIITTRYCEKPYITKYKMKGVQSIAKYTLDEGSCLIDLDIIDEKRLIMLVNINKKPSLMRLRTSDLQHIGTNPLSDYTDTIYQSSEFQYLGNGTALFHGFIIKNSQKEVGFCMVNMDQRPLQHTSNMLRELLFSADDLARPLRKSAIVLPIPSHKGQYILQDRQNNVFLGNIIKSSLYKIFSNPTECVVKLCKHGIILGHHKKYANSVQLMEPYIYPDLNYDEQLLYHTDTAKHVS